MASATLVLAEKIAESLSSPPPGATPRRTSGDVRLPGKPTAIIGMRRAGKTTFAHQLCRERSRPACQSTCHTSNSKMSASSASTRPNWVPSSRRTPAAFPTPRTRGPVVWTFDEMQVVPGWERLVRRPLDTDGHEVVVTGSSAALLSREVATTLRGRAWQVLIHPFSFAEDLDHHHQPIPDDPSFLTAFDRARLEHAFMQ